MKNEKTTVKNQIDAITPNEQARAAFPHILKELKKEAAERIEKNANEKKYFLDCYKKAIKKAEAVAAAQTLTACRVSVEWKKSRVWGYNPAVTVDAWTVDTDGAQECATTTGRASGCGYDKQSTAIAEAFNASAPSPYTVSVGNATSPPSRIISPAACIFSSQPITPIAFRASSSLSAA